MMDREKKLRLYQFFFLISGIALIIFTFMQRDISKEEKIISKNLEQEIEEKLNNKKIDDINIFYNVKYSGIDLQGNRYTLQSEEATSSELDQNVIKMKNVIAIFYFEDDKTLKVSSDEGEYNNKNLDIFFYKNVKAYYLSSQLYAEKARFSNSKKFLTVSNNVKIIDSRGTMEADKLLFDIESKTLNIVSEENKLIKSIINYK